MPAIESVPDPVGYDAAKLDIFRRLNAARAAAGLGLLEQSVKLDAAAQAHAAWQSVNGLCSHDESSGTPGFTGETPTDRVKYQGYELAGGGAEVIAYSSDPQVSIDGLLSAFYHRAALLEPSYIDVGIGRDGDSQSICNVPTVLEVTIPGGIPEMAYGQQMKTDMRPVAVWPVDGARNVPATMGNEDPNPVPGSDVMELGEPISVISDPADTIDVLSFILIDASTGLPVPVVLRTSDNDPNRSVGYNYVGIIPLAPLKIGTEYAVNFAGVVGGVHVERSWKFSTTAVN